MVLLDLYAYGCYLISTQTMDGRLSKDDEYPSFSYSLTFCFFLGAFTAQMIIIILELTGLIPVKSYSDNFSWVLVTLTSAGFYFLFKKRYYHSDFRKNLASSVSHIPYSKFIAVFLAILVFSSGFVIHKYIH